MRDATNKHAGHGAKRWDTSQGGYILLGVIALLGLVMTVTAALLSMTLTATRLSEQTRMSAAVVSAADSALEQAVAEMRRNDAVLSPTRADADGGTANCPGATAHGSSHPRSYEFTISATIEDSWTVIVDCETVLPIGDSRDVSIRASLTSGPGVGSGSGVLGAARVVITDRTASHESPGHRMRICDWQLGQTVTPSMSGCWTATVSVDPTLNNPQFIDQLMNPVIQARPSSSWIWC